MHELLDRYSNFHRVGDNGKVYTTRTRLVRIESGVHSRVGEYVRPLAAGAPVAVFYDANTREVAGDEVVASLRSAGVACTTWELTAPAGLEDVLCDDDAIAHAAEMLRSEPFGHAIAVGSGTINDIVKMASFQCGIDYSVVATAPSMNGFTSAIAAILSEGVKTTQPCNAPICAFADPHVMAAAPYRMIASGLGDLYSKPVSNADWRLSHRLLGTEHSPIVMEIVNAAGGLLEGVAPQLPGRDPDAVAKLTASIMLSGLGMQAAGSSGPASGGEHLVSHYIDMTAIAFGEPHDFHGCQVAVGTCATISLYDELRSARPEDFDLDRLVGAHPEWPDYEPVLRTRFEGLEDAVLSHARKMYPTRDDVAARLTAIFDSWDDLFRDVGETLRPPAELRAELESAECPVRFDQIGVTPERAFRAVAWSKDIRARYTVLHLASELGVLDDFAKRYTSD